MRMIDLHNPDFSNTPVSEKRPFFQYDPVDPTARPYLTIITPFFNGGEIFRETALSVLHQSFQQWEWIIVNDGSTDPRALTLLDEYRFLDPRIQVLDLPNNQGVSVARNIAVQAARTAYIAHLDSDDLLEPTALEKWLWYLEAHPEYGFVKGYSVAFGEQEYLWPRGFQQQTDFLRENQVTLTSLMRTAVYTAAGGHQEAIRGGFEDWDFWLRCAQAGYWGYTIPEYHDWYRRRANHSDRWEDWDGTTRQQQFRVSLQKRYAELYKLGLPKIQPWVQKAYETLPTDLPCANRLKKVRPRILMILPWLTMGGADKFNLDLLKLLVEQYGYEVTIATTLTGDHSWMPAFAAYTPDIFPLCHFVRLVDYPRLLVYLIHSRQIDTVLLSNSYLGYLLLPYLRAYCPDVTLMDYIHMEEQDWKNGGYPRASINHAEQLDLTVVSSQHLKSWMAERGGDADRIEICTTNIDTNDWDPQSYDCVSLRRDLGIGPEETVILYAGRICEQKQPRVFAEVMLNLTRRGLPYVCLVAGNGPDLPWLEQFVAANHLSGIRILGAVHNRRIRELMALSDIFFLPSEMEGISLALYEAMAMEAVPVGADVGGQRELVTPDCGILVTHDQLEIAAYTEHLTQLLLDPASRSSMGRNARHRVQNHFYLGQMGERMVQLIKQANTLKVEHPRPAISQSLGLDTARQAIEQVRLEQMAEHLWQTRQSILSTPSHSPPTPSNLAVRTMSYAKHALRPAYRWAVNHHMPWLVPIRNRLYDIVSRWLLQRTT